MTKSRLEAFSDGVLAIIITIMILEIKVPEGDTFEALQGVLPSFLSYVLSFIFIGIYWSNHHHMMHAVTSVNGAVLWANLALLFWLSLIPFATNWMSENHFTTVPVALYGMVLLMCAISYTILVQVLLRHLGKDSLLAKALGSDIKGWISLAMYGVAVLVAFYNSKISLAIYIAVALVWLIPDRRIEKKAIDLH
ncbi:MAG: hypothetical protein BGO69_05095 [Bacteroidetes bacterium 46-16]|mgnify:CR=1 FL=1|nr:MAG: hypothetical protein BGO69_05095 [Bacteroidetes bacterium 46-16]